MKTGIVCCGHVKRFPLLKVRQFDGGWQLILPNGGNKAVSNNARYFAQIEVHPLGQKCDFAAGGLDVEAGALAQFFEFGVDDAFALLDAGRRDVKHGHSG